MLLSFGDRKLRLIQEIMNLKSEQSLKILEEEIKTVQEIEKKKEPFFSAIKPIHKSVSLEELIKKQAYIPIKKEDFYRKVENLNIQESLDELLAMLSK